MNNYERINGLQKTIAERMRWVKEESRKQISNDSLAERSRIWEELKELASELNRLIREQFPDV